jgi:hypothetical protein
MMPAFDRSETPSREMTDEDIRMAKAVACCPLLSKSKRRGSMRLLHARSLSNNRYITTVEAAELRAFVIEYASALEKDVVAMAEA